MINVNINPIFNVALNEFRRILVRPLVIIVLIIILILMFLNGIYSSAVPIETNSQQDLFIMSFSGVLYESSQYLVALSVFIGAMSLAEERSKHSLSILLTKPLYRRDLIIGKFLGLNVFLLLYVLISLVACTLFLFIFRIGPLSMADFGVRFISMVIISFLECSLAMGIAMFAGILMKSVLQSALIAVTFLFISGYSPLLGVFGSFDIFVSPFELYLRVLSGNSGGALILLDTSIGYIYWLYSAIPFIILLLFEVLAIVMIDCTVFIRSEET